MILALVAACWFYIFPTLIGRAVIGWFKQKDSLKDFFLYFISGSLILYTLAIGLSVFRLFTPSLFYSILVILTGVSVIANGVISSLFITNKHHTHHHTLRTSNILIYSFILITISIISFVIWNNDVPVPYGLNWDMFEHQTLINLIQQGTFSFKTSQISDTFQFDGYSSIFHLLNAIPQIIWHPEPARYWWIIQGLHLLSSVCASFYLGYVVTKRIIFGFIAAIIGAFSFESYVAYATLFLVPQTFTAVCFAYGLGMLLEQKELLAKRLVWILPVLFLFLFLNHYIIGSAAIVLLCTVVCLLVLFQRWPKSYRGIVILLPLITFGILTFFTRFIDLSAINGGEALQYVYTPQKLFEFMQVFFGNALIFLGIPGIIFSFHEKDNKYRIVSIAGLLVLAVVVSGIPYALKFYVLGHYLIGIVMAGGIWLFAKNISSKIIQCCILLFLTLWFSIHLLLNAVYWKNDIHYDSFSTHYSQAELDAATFLQAYDTQDVLLLSDPATQYSLEAFSGMNSQGGAYMNNNTRYIVGKLFRYPTTEELIQELQTIQDPLMSKSHQRILLVMSGRLFQWINLPEENQQDITINIWAPAPLSYKQRNDIEQFRNYHNFNKIYENRDLIILEIPLTY